MSFLIQPHQKSVRFSEVATIVTGTTPSTTSRELYGNEIPFVTPGDLGEQSVISDSRIKLSKQGAAKCRLLPKDAVMVCCIGATIGKVGIAAKSLVTNQQINSLVFDSKTVFPKYGYYFCKTLKPFLVHISSSTTLPIVNKSRFSEISIPILPMDEQKRIAEILDKAHALREKRLRSITLLTSLNMSLFSKIFELGHIANRWNQSQLAEVAEVVSGVAKGRTLRGTTSETPYLRVANVQSGYLELSEIKTIPASENEVSKLTFTLFGRHSS